jgi:hypothetical protein
MHLESRSNYFSNQIVGHQLASSDVPPDTSGELSMPLDIPAKDISHANVDQVEVFLQKLGLGTLAASLYAHDDVLVHGWRAPKLGLLGKAKAETAA